MDINMAILQQFTPEIGGSVVIVRIQKVVEQLPANAIDAYRAGHSLERTHQLLCADQVVSVVLGEHTKVIRDDEGAPLLEGRTERLSISHTDDYMAIYVHENEEVAIDIELKGRDISAVEHRFTQQGEVALLKQAGAEEALLQLWSIKECLFKVIPVNRVLFKEHLILKEVSLNNGKWHQQCEVSHPQHQQHYSVVSRIFAPLIVSYTVVRSID